MSPTMNNSSSPLSSAESLPTPPGAWLDSSPPSPAAPANPINTTKFNLAKDGAPVSPSSSRSTTSSASKKRSHTEVDDQTFAAMASKKRTKLAPLPLSGTRASGRTRKAPERFESFKEPSKKVAPPRKTGSKVFDPTYLMTNSNSRLKKTDVFHMLLKTEAWTCLTINEKLDILALLPQNPINVELAKDLAAGTAAEDALPREVTLNFNLFRTDVAKFKEDLVNGHLAKTWQLSAEQAVIDRAAGAFDDWKDEQAEAWWGQN
ncbi:hypothetical protein N0V90_010919 [Kalmusia sp. IMI 367209]|nr:hypothetical protein N0V90_010919 [Kalmusia sp. IMI 367209]